MFIFNKGRIQLEYQGLELDIRYNFTLISYIIENSKLEVYVCLR